jgi:hypothetical protein
MNVRTIAAGFFLVLGCLMTVPASLTIWQERNILNEDRFVNTVTSILDDQDVQTAVASRMTDAVMIRLDVPARLDAAITRLDERSSNPNVSSLNVLEGPIESVARDAVYGVCLRIIQSDIGSNARELVLRLVHRSFIAIIQNDGEYLKGTGGKIVLDVSPLIDEAVRTVAGEKAASTVSQKLGDDGAQIVLVQSRNDTIIWRMLGWIDDLDPVVPIIAAILLVIAVLLAHDRIRMIGVIGGAIVLVTGLTLFLVVSPLKGLATSWPPRPEGQTAAVAAYNVLLDSFRRQELLLVLGGVAMMAFSVGARSPRFAKAFREESGGDAGEGARSWVAEHLSLLRGVGLGVTALVLLLWNDPTPRIFVTAVLLLLAYLGVLWGIASETQAARYMRRTTGHFVQPNGSAVHGDANLIARWSGILRVAGILVAAAILVIAPGVTLRLITLVVAGLLLYLAALDYLASRGENQRDEQ